MTTQGKHIPWIDAKTWIPMETGAYPSVMPDAPGHKVSYVVIEREQVGKPFEELIPGKTHLVAPIRFPASFHGCDDAMAWARENGGAQFEAGSTLRYAKATAAEIAFLMKTTPGTLVVGDASWTDVDILLELLKPSVDGGTAFRLKSGRPDVPGGKVGKSSGYAVLANGSAFSTFDRYKDDQRVRRRNWLDPGMAGVAAAQLAAEKFGGLKQVVKTRSGEVVVKRKIAWIEEGAPREAVNEITDLLKPDDVFVVG